MSSSSTTGTGNAEPQALLAATSATESGVAETSHNQPSYAEEHQAPAANTYVSKKCDKTYELEWRRFKKFIDNDTVRQRRSGLYLTRENVDYYFRKDVLNQIVTMNSVRRIIDALQWFADNVEHSRPKERFHVYSQNVALAVQCHNVTYRQNQLKFYQDAHAFLPTDIPSMAEEDAVIEKGIRHSSWKDFLVSWNVCQQTMICDGSARLIRLCDLHYDSSRGPDDFSNDKKEMISIIIPRGPGNVPSSRKRVAGMWRHRDWRRCGTGMIAANLFCRFFYDTELHFRHEEREKNPFWYSYKLLSWSLCDQHINCYRAVYDDAGVPWTKAAHVQTSTIHISQMGGNDTDDIVHMMTKEGRQRLVTSCLPELPPHKMHTASGFSVREGKYFVPRIDISFRDLIPGRPELSGDDLAHLLFPRLATWREQQSTMSGNYKEAGRNFLFGILPFLAKVLVQDGIYWVTEFPGHDVSRLLEHVLGGPAYVKWALKKRKEVDESVGGQDTQIRPLDAGAQPLLSSAIDMKTEIIRHLDQISCELASLNRAVSRLAEHYLQNQQTTEATIENAIRKSIKQIGLRIVPANIQHETICSVPAVAKDTTHQQQMLQPSFPREIPDTMAALLEQHLTYRLEDYAPTSKKGWHSSVSMAYSRRHYLFGLIKAEAERLPLGNDYGARLQKAAQNLDDERGSMTVSKYCRMKKGQDLESGKAKPRKRRRVEN